MDARLINPFIDAVDAVFGTMLALRPRRQPLRLGAGNGRVGALTALVGISGQMHGVVLLSFPVATAWRLAGRLLGCELREVTPEVVDAVSELVNMVAGAAKACFDCDRPLELGLPTVIEGGRYRVKYPSRVRWLEVPFTCAAGEFSMEVSFRTDRGSGDESTRG